MFIKNFEQANIKDCYSCDEETANILIKLHKIPILSISNGKYYFSKSKKLKDALMKID